MTYSYGNDKGIGFFYPEKFAVVSGISKIYGLAYVDEGWLELDRGVGEVIVNLGNQKSLPARKYVKNRYWVRTFDTAEFKDGPLEIEVTAYDKDGITIGTVTNTVIIDHSRSTVKRRLYAATDGQPGNKGDIGSPIDLVTALNTVEPGDVLFIRNGVYTDKFVMSRSGLPQSPIIIMNYEGEKVELRGTGIDIVPGVEYVDLMGIDQSGARFEDSGLELSEDINYMQFWDCSFNDNTHPYEEIEPNKRMNYGVGFQALTVRGGEGDKRTSWAIEGQNRQFITVSHCEAKYNDVDGFDFSSINHGRFQYLEAAYNPCNKTKDVFQYKHADGFTLKNSEFEPWGFPSEDNVFLFCYSHHNGQDGFDIRPPHVYMFGCISHDEAFSGLPFGGSGFKTWEYDYKFYNCLSFRNNIVDDSGYALEAGNNTYICNSLFYNAYEYAVARPDEDPRVTRIFSNNNIFVDYNKGFAYPVISRHSIFYGHGDPSTLTGAQQADPLLMDPEKGNFFLKAGSPAITGGKIKGFTFVVDGVDYMVFDALGRPRTSMHEIGPYTRYADIDD